MMKILSAPKILAVVFGIIVLLAGIAIAQNTGSGKSGVTGKNVTEEGKAGRSGPGIQRPDIKQPKRHDNIEPGDIFRPAGGNKAGDRDIRRPDFKQSDRPGAIEPGDIF